MKGLKVFVFLQNTDTIQHTHILTARYKRDALLENPSYFPMGMAKENGPCSYTENKEGSMRRQKSWQKSRDRKMHGCLHALN